MTAYVPISLLPGLQLINPVAESIVIPRFSEEESKLYVKISLSNPLGTDYRTLRVESEFMGQVYFSEYTVAGRFRNADSAAAYNAVQVYVSAGTMNGSFVVRGFN